MRSVSESGAANTPGTRLATPFFAYISNADFIICVDERLWMRKFRIEGAEAGKVWDVHTSLDNLERLYKRGGDPPKGTPKREDGTVILPREPAVQRNSADYQELVHSLNVLQNLKLNAQGGRNTWQARQRWVILSEESFLFLSHFGNQ